MVTRRTIYLHIGTEKTGTTTVQAMFSANRLLLANAGVLYPVTPGDANHAGLPIYALPQASRPGLYAMLRLFQPAEVAAYRDRFATDFTAELDRSPCEHIVISSEHLSSRVRHPPAMRRLFDLLGKLADSVKVIVYLRPQHELAPSLYSTQVKSGTTKRFCIPESDTDYYYNYDLLTRNWERYVGRGNITVRVFSKSEFKNASLIDDVFDAMSLPLPAGLTIPPDKNTALSAHALEFLRHANGSIRRLLETRINPEHLGLSRLLTALGSSPKFEIDHDLALAIERTFRLSNAAVAARYFPHSDGQLFSPVKTSREKAWHTTPEDLVRVGVEIWKMQASQEKLGRRWPTTPV